MEAFNIIVTSRATDLTDEVRKNIHLSTGTRTEFCEALLKFICHHQKLEIAFQDSVTFFMESLTAGVRLEEEVKSLSTKVNELMAIKEDGVIVTYNLE